MNNQEILKQYQDAKGASSVSNNTSNYYIPSCFPQPCPTCGRCPTCGQGYKWSSPHVTYTSPSFATT